MALIIHFIKAPRYKNIMTEEYETVQFDDLNIINEYFNWKRCRDLGITDCTSLKDWCGVLESDMPHKYIVNYYSQFYGAKSVYNDYDGELMDTMSIFEDLARIVKTNQVFNWLVNNVTDGIVDNNYHEIPEDKMRNLCESLKVVKEHIDVNTLNVNEDVAKENMPIMDDAPVFWGAREYEEIYAQKTLEANDIIHNIFNTTNFEKENIYFVAHW